MWATALRPHAAVQTATALVARIGDASSPDPPPRSHLPLREGAHDAKDGRGVGSIAVQGCLFRLRSLPGNKA